jgi:hypothetical protein
MAKNILLMRMVSKQKNRKKWGFMKRFFIVWMVFLFFITNAFAEGEFSLRYGLSSMHLKDVSGAGISIDPSDTRFEKGLLGVDYMWDIFNSWKIGARLERACSIVTFSPCCPLCRESRCRTSLQAVMVGGSYNKSISKKINLNGKLFLGYSSVHFKSERYYILTPKYPKKIDERATCFIAELSIGMQYFFTKKFGAGVEVGYSYTPEINPLKDIKLDLSGVIGTLNFTYKV